MLGGLVVASALAADEPPPDEAFLEFLGSWNGEEGDDGFFEFLASLPEGQRDALPPADAEAPVDHAPR